jgi:sialate O-acetylesterase
MRGKLMLKSFVGLLLLSFAASLAAADVKLPGVFGDHMLLQRDTALPVWGWADPGEKVTVTLAGQSQSTTADGAGKWSVQLAPLEAGGPHVLRVQGKNTLERTDVLVGEVWLCSGQSNMAMTVGAAANKEAELAAANHPQIRICHVTRNPAQEPQTDCEAPWKVCSPETVGTFSASAYFFGRELHKVLGVPVGLINSSVGGTPVQAWTGTKAQEALPELKPLIETLNKAIAAYDPATAQQRYEKQLVAWKQAVAKAKAEGKQAPRKPQLQDPNLSQNSPGRLYNGMIAPLAPYGLRGAIWYQGESNAGGPAAGLYGLQLRTMISNWRQDWRQGDFPFIYVQLPNFKAPQKEPSETDGWPIVREQMLKTLALSNAGMAVTIDIGEERDIHPKNKQDVGQRLAQWALAKTYGKDVVACGPLYKSLSKQGNSIVLYFDYVDGGLVAKGGAKLQGFAIAGDDKKFVWAEAKIEGGCVTVSSPEVKAPAAVRYAWANNPDCNLCNQAGLPASPFRTDDWGE